ncbi:MAG: Fe2+-dependent dioxygenase [Alphaproteobacteria bacterium HGW-Alphaproteobacteria-18]|nr:MAG: Fe2+-dependent dioxygenase [Alphaproteobacteria bacterium HGW-Alphaproteobacteria-18]
MIVIEDVLSQDVLSEVSAALRELRWEDGRNTAGATARRVKRNQQADLSSRTGSKVRDVLLEAVTRHPVVEAYARPLRFAPPLISCTGEGDTYGLHIDNPVMGKGEARLRTDLSLTLFLSPPESYEGGELEIETVFRTESIKLPAGSMVIYPSTELHRVAPVTSGERFVFVSWIQSAIRDAAQRAILFDITNLKAGLARSFPPGSPELLSLAKTESNLLRMWADT